MTIHALTCTHGRSETVEIFLQHMYFPITIIDSSEYKNDPLGAKWNYGLSKCKELDLDYLLITGSDNLFSPGLIESLTENKVHYSGLLDFYFYDIEKDILKYCPGFRYSQSGHPHGAGRVIHRSVLETLDWKLWDDNLNSGLDNSMTRRLKNLDLSSKFVKIPEGMYAVDLKTSNNLHTIHEYPGLILGEQEKKELRDHFQLEYV